MAAVQLAKENLIDFSILTGTAYKPSWHHHVVASALEDVARGKIKRLMLFMPPRHGKSQLASIDFPSWFLGRSPNKEIITASYAADLALDFGAKTRRKMESEQYRAIFATRLRADERAKAKWVTEAGGSYTSVGIGGPITGRGAHVFILDDPIKNREEAESKTTRDKVWDWYTSTAYTRLENGGAIILILTRWHSDDLAGRILASETAGAWQTVKLPALAEAQEEYRDVGEALWQEKYPVEELQKIKATIGTYDWNALYQQHPIASETQEFFYERFKFRTQEEVDHLNTRKFLSIDTAISARAEADFTGICENFVDRENFWNLNAWRTRLSPKELIDFIFTQHAKRSYEKIGIEKTIYIDALKPFLDDEMRRRNVFLPIVELHHNQTAKEVRIRGLLPRYESGSIFHIAARDLEDELIAFPRGIHDDVADAAAYQLQLAVNTGSISGVIQTRPSWVSFGKTSHLPVKRNMGM